MYDIKTIIAKTNLQTLIEETHSTQKMGKHVKMACPFHHENEPSMVIYKDSYYCYGCKERGDAIDWLCKMRGLEWRDAVSFLAEKAGFEAQDKSVKSNVKSNIEKWHNSLNDKALEYLKKRGIEKEVETYKIGYCDSGQLKGHIIFPITAVMGKALGFTSRNLGNDGPKSINSKNSKTFQKSEVLFGIEQAWKHAQKLNQMILVEGAIDAIRVATEGHKNVVALLGGNLSDNQLSTIMRYCGDIIIYLDNDVPGQHASDKIAIKAYNAGMHVWIAIPDTDPAESDVNADLEAVSEFMGYCVKDYDEEKNLDKKIQKETRLKNIIRQLEGSRREYWRNKLPELKVKKLENKVNNNIEQNMLTYISMIPAIWKHLDELFDLFSDENIINNLRRMKYENVSPVPNCMQIDVANPMEEVELIKKHLLKLNSR